MKGHVLAFLKVIIKIFCIFTETIDTLGKFLKLSFETHNSLTKFNHVFFDV